MATGVEGSLSGGPSGPQDDLRVLVSAVLLEQGAVITADAESALRFSGPDSPDRDYCQRLGRLLVGRLAAAVLESGVDPRGGFIAGLCAMVLERSLTADQLFTFTYLTERAALDELAASDRLGASSESWPLVAQMVRRASFDLLAAFAARAQMEPNPAAITDRLTSLHTRPVFDAALVNDVERAARSGCALSLILFDVDRLSAINEQHGYGVGDRLLERLGVLIRTYFRRHDWIARYSDDAIAVLLTGAGAERAAELAERVRATVAERMGFPDHRAGGTVRVTVSAAVVRVEGSVGTLIDPERLLLEAESALDRAKRQGRNRVERVSVTPATRIPPRSSPSA